MLDSVSHSVLRAQPVSPLPVDRLLLGKPVEEAAELLPRLFNLCRNAQSLAARAAFGLPLDQGWQIGLRQEILRDHVIKLCIKWPGLLSQPANCLPAAWQHKDDLLRQSLFGAGGNLPSHYSAFENFLECQDGIAPILRAIRSLFAPHEGCRAALPIVTPARMFDCEAQENSPAARRADHPVLRSIAMEYGFGALWSATAVAYDLQALLNGDLPETQLLKGFAVVPAARGLYAVRADVEQGRVTSFQRITPTDHLLAPGGALEQSLSSLPSTKSSALAPLLLSILDPCYPIRLLPVSREEPTHA